MWIGLINENEAICENDAKANDCVNWIDGSEFLFENHDYIEVIKPFFMTLIKCLMCSGWTPVTGLTA